MNILKKTVMLAGCVATLGLGTGTVMAQGGFGGGGGGGGGGGFGGPGGPQGGPGGNPQARLGAYRTALAVTDDAEWTALSAKVQAVMDAQQATRGGGRGGGGPGGGGPGGPGGGGPGGGGPTPTEAEAALQKAIDDKAPAAEIKSKMAAVHTERADKAAKAMADYKKAQGDLRALLTARQEAIVTLRTQPDPNADGFAGFGLPPLFPE